MEHGPGEVNASSDQRLTASRRIRAGRDFQRVFSRGQRAHGKAMVLVAMARQDPDHRLGVSVSKDHGCAVRRNKIKRLLREAFRLERATLPGQFDLVLIPKQRPGHYDLAELRAELRQLLGQICNRKPRGRGTP